MSHPEPSFWRFMRGVPVLASDSGYHPCSSMLLTVDIEELNLVSIEDLHQCLRLLLTVR
jgi:hypothetical protein